MLTKQLQALLDLLSETEYITAEALSKAMACSAKTARIRLHDLDDCLKKHGAALYSKAHYGYRLDVTDRTAYQQWQNAQPAAACAIPQTAEARFFYLCTFLLKQDGYIKLEDLADQLYVSRATLSNDLRQVRALFEKYQLSLVQKPNYGIRLESADEFNVRRCLRDLYFQQTDFAPQNDRYRTLGKVIWDELNLWKVRLSEIAFDNFVHDVEVALRRVETGHTVSFAEPVPLTLRPKEQQFVQSLLQKLSHQYGITFCPDEVTYISLHLAGKKNSGLNNDGTGNFVIREDIDQLVLNMLDSVESTMSIPLKDNLELRMMLNQHMAALDIRLRYHIPLANPQRDEIRSQYLMAYTVAVQASTVLTQRYQREIPDDEIAYLAIIFALALEKQRQGTASEKLNILIVCGSGKSSARLLEQKYLQEFGHYIGKLSICDRSGLESADFQQVDYIFTTIPIDCPVPKPILQIGMFLEHTDRENVHRILRRGRKGYLSVYYTPQRFFAQDLGSTPEQILKNLCTLACHLDGLPHDLFQSVMERERLVATDFGARVAIPHPMRPTQQTTRVYVAVLPKPVFWSRQEVQVIIMSIVGLQEDHQLQKFYRATTDLISDPSAVQALIDDPTYETLMRLL